MAHDTVQAVPQPAVERDIALPTPRPPVLDTPAPSLAPVPGPVAQASSTDAVPPASRPAGGSRAGWILSAVVAAGAAWAVGWVAGVTWAWREMGPHLSRARRRRGTSLPI
jgi:hypothetical protein